MHQITRRALLALAAAVAISPAFALPASALDVSDWATVEKEAKGQTVYFHAWGGSQAINDYIRWAGDTLKERHGVTLEHVKLEDTATAVATVLAEKTAGRDEGGRVDLIWINGENFAAMKRQDLLLTPGWAPSLPNYALADTAGIPTIETDFTIPTEGLESPWGGAKLVFFHDTAVTKPEDMPKSVAGLADWTAANPGRFSYPAPPDFIGSSFLKQALSETIAEPAKLLQPVDEATFEADVEPLFALLDRMHPNLWRSGRAFVKNYPAMVQGLADGELDIAFAFNPGEASSAIAQGRLPETVRSFTFPGGTLGNTHFVAVPFNANAKAGALVTANFLLSPEAQARKQDPAVWGDPTVLNVAALPDAERARFEKLDLGIATLPPEKLGPVLPEPHPSWMTAIEEEWKRRYSAGN